MYKALETALVASQATLISPKPVIEIDAPTELAEPVRKVDDTPRPVLADQTGQHRSRRTLWWALTSIVLLLLAAGAFTLFGGSDRPVAQTQTTNPALSSGASPTAPLQVSVPTMLGNYLTNVQALAVDNFDGKLEDMWAASNASQSGSRMTITGKEYWASSATLHQTISEGQGIYLIHRFTEEAEFEFYMQNGALAGIYKRFGFYGGETPKANLFLGGSLTGSDLLKGNFTPKPDTWYYSLLAVDKNANFTAMVWDASDDSRLIYYRQSLDADWDNLTWQFIISANRGVVDIDDVVLFSFDKLKR